MKNRDSRSHVNIVSDSWRKMKRERIERERKADRERNREGTKRRDRDRIE